ncbi:sugar O-acetyltransferase [Actinobaculum suis]|nr:sugar O-acetyltransferase [Actinobaculum suis]MDY5152882.1 sugar O-acetyltransferase [Actinobaculum suis]
MTRQPDAAPGFNPAQNAEPHGYTEPHGYAEPEPHRSGGTRNLPEGSAPAPKGDATERGDLPEGTPSPMWERMVAGKLYNADDPFMARVRQRTLAHQEQLNLLSPHREEEVYAQASQLFGHLPRSSRVCPPTYCDYGQNTSFGENCFVNVGSVFLDVAPITIGDNVMIGPRVTLTTASHPIHPAIRNRGLEYGAPITIKNGVWLGASVTVGPGVTIGENSIIGAGAVVMRDVPANVIMVGVPARVLRHIDDSDYEQALADLAAYEEEVGPVPGWREEAKERGYDLA